MGTDINVGTDMIGGDRLTQNTMDSESKKNPGAGWVGVLVIRDFRSHSGFSEHSLDSESKFEPSVAIDIIGGDRHKSWGQTL